MRRRPVTVICPHLAAALLAPFLALAPAGCGSATPEAGGGEASASDDSEPAEARQVRIAVFNIKELSREKVDAVDAAGRGKDPQLLAAAEVLQEVRPDVVLINEIDFDEGRQTASLFVDRYLAVGEAPLSYPYHFFEPVNTGVPSGLDLDNDGATDGPADAWGFGRYPGQYGMALLSRFPLDTEAARSFRTLLWKTMPGNLMPDGRGGKPSWYDRAESAVLRLSSKSHWDVPLEIPPAEGAGAEAPTRVHLLASHPTPPVFDGEEDHNGRRNFDEIRLWADYLSGGPVAEYIVDDEGRQGGLPEDAAFVLLGDLNADPYRGDASYGQPAIRQLLGHPRVRDPRPGSEGGAAHTPQVRPGREPYPGPPHLLTSGFGRIDYVLPSRNLEVQGSGVFWPAGSDGAVAETASDHRLVWVDLRL